MEKSRTIPARPVLGKGLASLLPGAAPLAQPQSQQAVRETESNKDRLLGISMCNVDDIVPNEFQPRRVFNDETIQELSASIKANGLIQPLIVRKNPTGGFQLIAGERRWRASKLAGLKQVPIVIRRTTDKESLELALIENIQREDLNCLDTALSYYQLINDFELTQEDMSVRVGKDRTTITNHLRLLKLPQFVQGYLKKGDLSFGHGRALASLEDSALVERIAREVAEKKWSVRELENQIQKIKNLQKGRSADASQQTLLSPLVLRLKNLGKELSNKFSAKVQCKGNEKRGKIVIEYHSAEDLDRVLNQLMR